MKLETLSLPVTGAQIVGWEFSSQYDEDTTKQVRLLLLKHKVLLFRGNVLSPDQLKAFARMFGKELAVGGKKWWHSEEHKEVFQMTNKEALTCGCELFHCDGHYLDDPCGVTCTNMVKAGPEGALSIADMQTAYDSLPDKAKVALSLLYSANEKGAVHPLVIRHPATGRLSLYINRYAATVDSTGKKYPEIDIMLDKLLAQSEVFYKHHWETGDLVVVDNYAVTHRVCAAIPDGDANEVLIRAQTTGKSTFWNEHRSTPYRPEPAIRLQAVAQQQQAPAQAQKHCAGCRCHHCPNCACFERSQKQLAVVGKAASHIH